MQNEKSQNGIGTVASIEALVDRFTSFWTLHFAFCILHFSFVSYWWYAFSPASTRIASRFWRGGSGQVAKSVKAHGGL